MSAFVDNLLAFRVLSMLVTPFEETDAFKYGIIDKDGNALKKVRDLTKSDERASYTALHRLVFNLKKLLAKLPGGSSRFASLIAAYWLIKENYETRYTINEDQLMEVIHLIESKNITLVEEEIDVKRFLKQIGEEGIINAVGPSGGVNQSVDQPAIKPKKKLKLFRRQKEGEYVKV